jgi:hypothetical protein
MQRHLASLLCCGVTLSACGGGDPPGVELAELSRASGPLSGGVTLTLTGSGFLSNLAQPNQVYFGARAAPVVTVLDDTTLEVELPSATAAGQVSVKVVNRNGVAELANAFTYQPGAMINALLPPRGPLLGGRDITIRGAGFATGGNTEVWFGDVPGTNVRVMDPSTIVVTSPPGDNFDEVDVRVVDDNGVAELPDSFRFVNPSVAVFDRWGTDGIAFRLIDVITGTRLLVPLRSASRMPEVIAAATRPDGRILVATRETPPSLYEVDLDGNLRYVTTTNVGHRIMDMTFIGDTLYAVIRQVRRGSGGPAKLARLDPRTGMATEIGSPTPADSGAVTLASLAGALYYFKADTGGNNPSLHLMSSDSGALLLAPAPVPVKDLHRVTGAVFVGNRLFVISLNDPRELFEVDPTTGNTVSAGMVSADWNTREALAALN